MKIEKICLIEDCKKSHTAKGYCFKHYMRIKRHGDPNNAGKVGRKRGVNCWYCKRPYNQPMFLGS